MRGVSDTWSSMYGRTCLKARWTAAGPAAGSRRPDTDGPPLWAAPASSCALFSEEKPWRAPSSSLQEPRQVQPIAHYCKTQKTSWSDCPQIHTWSRNAHVVTSCCLYSFTYQAASSDFFHASTPAVSASVRWMLRAIFFFVFTVVQKRHHHEFAELFDYNAVGDTRRCTQLQD